MADALKVGGPLRGIFNYDGEELLSFGDASVIKYIIGRKGGIAGEYAGHRGVTQQYHPDAEIQEIRIGY